MDGKNEIGKKYLDLCSSKFGLDKKVIQTWIPIVAATQYTKGKESEKEFLEKWFNVVESL